ncbi:MAG TPA: hypothetical protein VGQ65_06115 [Thermoanaerobaculia bacterium]|jgi:hypothetical protein|nr:hypothetical protein [Thermoanaerobaculia bacterium]
MPEDLTSNLVKELSSESGYGRVSKRRWEDAAPWFLTLASTIILFSIAWFLVENIFWFRAHALTPADLARPTYRLHIYHLHLSMIKRSVGLFSGFALLFLGTGVVFYTLRTTYGLQLSAKPLSSTVASASPGILAMALGVVLLLGTIASKDDFPLYEGEAGVTQQSQHLTYVPYPATETTK